MIELKKINRGAPKNALARDVTIMTKRVLLIQQQDDHNIEYGFSNSMLNILEDAAGDKDDIVDSQSAAINILEGFGEEKNHLEATQRSVINILEDLAIEKNQMESTQKASLNILEDFDSGKNINRIMAKKIAERKKIEKTLKTANKELESISYSVSHDLRTPLRSRDGFSRVLLNEYSDKFDETGKYRLIRVRMAAQRMSSLIDDILKLSRVTRTILSLENVDISVLASDIAKELQSQYPERHVVFNISPGLKQHAVEHLLRLALENLLGNAWKFSPRPAETLIEFGVTLNEGRPVYFVRDNGAGFDMAYVNKLFGAFQRLHDTNEFPGTGIGLATVKRIIQKHGGRIWAKAAVDQGATFYFTVAEEIHNE